VEKTIKARFLAALGMTPGPSGGLIWPGKCANSSGGVKTPPFQPPDSKRQQVVRNPA